MNDIGVGTKKLPIYYRSANRNGENILKCGRVKRREILKYWKEQNINCMGEKYRRVATCLVIKIAFVAILIRICCELLLFCVHFTHNKGRNSTLIRLVGDLELRHLRQELADLRT